MGKGAKLPTPEAGRSRAASPLLSPKPPVTEYRNSVLTTIEDQNNWLELLKQRDRKVAEHAIMPNINKPTQVPRRQASPSPSPLSSGSRLPSRLRHSLELRPKILVDLQIEKDKSSSQFPKRERRSEGRPIGVGASRAYELVNSSPKKMGEGARKKSLYNGLIPGNKEFFNNASITQKLDWIGLQMRLPEDLENLRGASRDAAYRDENPQLVVQFLGHRRSSLVLKEDDEGDEEGRKGVVPFLDRKLARGSVVVLPVDPKHWLLQSLRLQESELQELFDQMEDVAQLNAYDITGIRDEWEHLDKREMKSPPELEMLVKDQALLDKIKNLLTRFIEIEESKRLKEQEEIAKSSGTESSEIESEMPSEGFLDTPPSFEGFKRNQEGNLLPMFSKGTTLCSLCGQMKPKANVRDMMDSAQSPESPASPRVLPSFIPVGDYVIHQSIVQPLGHEMEYKSTYSPQEKRWYTVLFPALQPRKREDVQLLGQWLQHATHDKKCEDPDGHIADIDCSFILHSIAFLEVVRQVSLECEERSDMLLHLWRQLLRIFNQVMARVEPKLAAVADELVHLGNVLASDRQKLAMLTNDLDTQSKRFKVSADQLKQKNLQFARLQRCRLCLAENLTPREREKFVRRATMKHFAGAGSRIQIEEEKSHEELIQDSLAAKNVSGPGGEGGGAGAEGGSSGLGSIDEEPGAGSGAEFAGNLAEGGEGVYGDGSLADSEGNPLVPISPGEIIPRVKLTATKKISQGFVHDDGLHADVLVQTDDESKKHSFWEVLQRPQTAPPRLNTTGMEVFEPLTAEQSGAFLKAKREQRLAREALKKARANGELGAGGAGEDEESEEGLKNLAAEMLEVLAKSNLQPAMANRLRGLLSRLRNLKQGKIGQDGELDDTAALLQGDLELGLDGDQAGEDGKKKGKKGAWNKLRKGGPDSRRGSSQFALVAEELMARNKRGSSELKPLKPKDLPFVPLGFAKLMKINPPPKNIKSFNERQLTKLLEGLYASKILADAVDDAADNDRQTACEFVYDYMLNTYGLKGLAESAVHGVFKKIKQMIIGKGIDKCHKVRLFQRFCGFDPAKAYGEPDLYMYLKVLQRAQSKVGVLYTEQDDGVNFLNCTLIDYITDEPTLVAHFGGSKDAVSDFINKFVAAHATTEKTSPELQKIVKLTHVKKVDFDLMMEAIIESNPHREVKGVARLKSSQKIAPLTKEEETELEDLFIAGDANQDGVLTFTEFREIISSADASVSNQNALRMFRETILLMPDGGDSISPQAFAAVAHAHGITAPDQIVFNLLKKTWNQVQDDINEEKVKGSGQKKEATELREKLEGMIENQEGADVSEAVQLFRTFVLKFCGGKDGDPKPPLDEGGENEGDESE